MNYLMIKEKIKNFIQEEDGIGTVEMILIFFIRVNQILKEDLKHIIICLHI